MTDNSKFDSWVQRYVDGQTTSEEVRQLTEQLRCSEQSRQRFIELMNLDSALHATLVDADRHPDHNAAVPELRHVSRSIEIDSTWRSRFGRRTFALLAVLGVLLVLVAGWWPMSSGENFATVRSAEGVAELPNAGPLPAGWHEVKAGMVELVTTRHAEIVIEAPARFRFESAQQLRLDYGRLVAKVPPAAQGFTVLTPTGDAIDLGTNFGVDVARGGDAEIHVFQGAVIAQGNGGTRHRNLKDGEALQLSMHTDRELALRTTAFIQSEEVALLHAALAAGQHNQSQAAFTQLKQDPALIALLDFESGDLPAGTYRMVQGRWPGSRAPEFVNQGDHMQLDVGGDRDWPQLTMAAWVRLDQLGAPYQSLLHTDGWNSTPGQVHWMVTSHTTMRLALYGNTLSPESIEREHFPDSRTSVLPEQGRWAHLAAVYDSDRKTVRFYLNGKFDSETRQEIAHPARLGSAQIGNWDLHDRKLSGRIDELILLGRAMSDAEIEALFIAGNPYGKL